MFFFSFMGCFVLLVFVVVGICWVSINGIYRVIGKIIIFVVRRDFFVNRFLKFG